MLMNNIVAVTGHIRKKLEAKQTEDIDRKVLKFVPCKDGKYYYVFDNKYWRVMVFIPDTVSKSSVTPESSYIVGETFGDFQAMLADIPVELGETIKDFHNIEFRLQQFHDAVKEDKMGRAAGVRILSMKLKSVPTACARAKNSSAKVNCLSASATATQRLTTSSLTRMTTCFA